MHSPRSGRVQGKIRQTNRAGLRPLMLVLEDRWLLSTFTVTDPSDSAAAGSPAVSTLRWAVEQANEATTPSTIDFNLADASMITLLQGQLELTNTSAAITIDGPGATFLSVSGNEASRVFQVDEGVTASISGLTITGGSADVDRTGYLGGGGLYNKGGTVAITDCAISGNFAFFDGGGLDNYAGATTLSDCTISRNSAGQDGGGLYGYDYGMGEPTLSLAGCTISGNSASRSGGGLESDITTTLIDCTITGNSSGISGGGLAGFSQATLSLTDCTVRSNSTGGHGGGLYDLDAANLTACTLSDNSATTAGGALQVAGGTTALTACTISGNSAEHGGGLGCAYGTTTLTACTISGNAAGIGGGLYAYKVHGENDGEETLTDTIVVGNSGGGGTPDDISGDSAGDVRGTYNMVGTGGSGGLTSAGHDLLDVTDPGLAPLGNNSGPTQTMALLPGSPAIGAGTAVNGVTTDQRGDPLDSPPDIGAYQVQPSTLPIAVESISAVTPATRNTPVASVSVTLNEPAGSGGFTASALSLTDNGGPNLISSAVSITHVSGSTYQISGLSGLTSSEGSYSLTINAADIQDSSGSPGTGLRSTSWLMDVTPPTSTVNPLPAQTTSTSFTVSVTASDPNGTNGSTPSGVASIAVYDSTNGGPFVLFGTVSPTSPSATFTGQAGDTYAFYSIATDKAGNVQPTPSAAQARTKVISAPTPTPTQTAIIGEQPLFSRKLKKGKPTGKAVLSGFTLDFGAPLNAAAAASTANYQLDTITTKKVKKKKEAILHSIAKFTVSYLAASDAVEITLGANETFPTGGQITVLGGLTTASGGTLNGPAVFTIAKGGKSVGPS